MAFKCSECEAFHAVLSPPVEAQCCVNWWVIPTSIPEDDDVDAKLDPEATPPGGHIFVNHGPFQCTNCKQSHQCQDFLNTLQCCPDWWLISLHEEPVTGYACTNCTKKHESLSPPQSSQCCENMTIVELY